MKCERAQKLLSMRLDGLLSSRQMTAVAAHLVDCSSCRQRQEGFLALEAQLSELATVLAPAAIERSAIEEHAIHSWRAEREAAATSPPHRRAWLDVLPSLKPRPELGRPAHRPLLWLGATMSVLFLVTAIGLTTARRDRSAGKPGAPRTAESRADAEAPGSLTPPPRMPVAGPPAPGPRSVARVFALPRPSRPIARRQRALPAGDLAALNGTAAERSDSWATAATEAWEGNEARARRRAPVGDDFVFIPFPRIASNSDRPVAGAVASHKREAAYVDPRLTRAVTLQFKATALSDLCDHLRAETGIHLSAGSSIADEKVTLFCRAMLLRDVMRQLSRPFGFTWLRSGKEGEHRYELVQDLRSQLLEEELRNRDRREALLALDREMGRFRKYQGLSPDEARARAAHAAPEEKALLEKLVTERWGAIQMYLRLSPRDLAALRGGQELRFAAEPLARWPDAQALPADVARGTLQSFRDWIGIERDGDRYQTTSVSDPDAQPPSAVPVARALVTLRLRESELGRYLLMSSAGLYLANREKPTVQMEGTRVVAAGANPARRDRQADGASAKAAGDPALRARVTVRPQMSCRSAANAGASAHPALKPGLPRALPEAPARVTGELPEALVNTADLVEALHRATGMNMVADYYTRLYPATQLTTHAIPLAQALDRLCDATRLRWKKEDGWLQFRSATYYDDRLKEVPNRLLERWAASRRQHGVLPLDDLIEIGQLSDAQLDAAEMADGARHCFGLTEWDLLRGLFLRSHIRYLAALTPPQRQQARSPEGLSLSRMTLAQQQGFLLHALSRHALSRDHEMRLENLTHATLHVDYTSSGWFRWRPRERGLLPSPVYERTREAALRAARRIDAGAGEAQIRPTQEDLMVLYTANPGSENAFVHVVSKGSDGFGPLHAFVDELK